MVDTPRMLELRRRIQADPASIAFAQLAEECRRVGSNQEAVDICRAGLARNPGYLSARVTLGRALLELGQLDAAKAELEIVVAGAPDNLAAIRGLAEILQRRGQMNEALQYYKRALELAKHDPDLEDTVERISQQLAPKAAPQAAGPPVSIEEIFNFDTLIDQLGLPADLKIVEEPATKLADEAAASEGLPSLEELFADEKPATEAAVSIEVAAPVTAPMLAEQRPASEAVTEAPAGPDVSLEDFFAEESPVIELTLDDSDSLAVMERELREREQQRVADERLARLALVQRRRAAMIFALETWLSAIVAERERPQA